MKCIIDTPPFGACPNPVAKADIWTLEISTPGQTVWLRVPACASHFAGLSRACSESQHGGATKIRLKENA